MSEYSQQSLFYDGSPGEPAPIDTSQSAEDIARYAPRIEYGDRMSEAARDQGWGAIPRYSHRWPNIVRDADSDALTDPNGPDGFVPLTSADFSGLSPEERDYGASMVKNISEENADKLGVGIDDGKTNSGRSQ